MEITDGNLHVLAGYLQKTLSPDPVERRGAEKFLESVEGSRNYLLLLLHLIDKADVDMHLRVGASITFKNFVKRNWKVPEDGPDKIHADDRQTVKSTIVTLMLKSPEQIQRQLSDAIGYIGHEDFPGKWPDLIPELVAKFQSGDFHVINGVLHTAHSLFKRYRYEFKSENLWREIKFVLDNFAVPLTHLFNTTMELSVTHANNKDAVKLIYSSLVLIAKIFYSLNFQDLPEFFEDNMATWMTHFQTLLSTNNPLLVTEDREEAGLLEQVKAQICENITMYAQKYDEEFSSHLPGFVTTVWNLLITTGSHVKYDQLVSSAIQFLASVAERPAYKRLFADSNTLTGICEKVIVPNMEFRDADEEAFEDNAEEYMRRDVEGSDVDTRRRAACDLVRALCKSFEAPVIQIFSNYVQHMLLEYSKNPSQNWKNKDAAIFLVTSLAAKAQTQKHGITQTSELVNVADFFNSHIVPDLQSADVSENPVLKADAIKYLMVFRNQLPREVLVASLGPLIKLLQAPSPVVHSYSALCLERILTVKLASAGGVLAVTKTELAAHSETLLTNLFAAMTKEGSQENEYVMKAVMRSLSVLQEVFVPHAASIITQLTQKLMLVSKNPSKPHFNHFLFESICVVISTACKVNPTAISTFEDGLFPPFQTILQQDVQEFIPYVFQVLALMLEMHAEGAVSPPYLSLFPHLLLPVLWSRDGNIPPLIRLLQAYITCGVRQIETDKLPGILGIFQKLLASKVNDHHGFSVVNCLIMHAPSELMSQYVQQIFILMFQRLQSSKTTKCVKCLLVFLCIYALKYGAASLIDVVDRVQAKMFGMVVEKLFVADLQKVSSNVDRKTCAVGVTKILTEAPAMLQADYVKLWPQLLQVLIGLFELPQDTTAVSDDIPLMDPDADNAGFQAVYSQLAFAGKVELDPCVEVQDVKALLAKSLAALCATQPDVKTLITTGLQAEAVTFLRQYLQAAGIQLL